MSTPSPFSASASSGSNPVASPFSAGASAAPNGNHGAASSPFSVAAATGSNGSAKIEESKPASPFAVFDASSSAGVGSNTERQTKIPEKRPVEEPPLAATAVTQSLQEAEKHNPFQLASEPQPTDITFSPLAQNGLPQAFGGSPFTPVAPGTASPQPQPSTLQQAAPIPTPTPTPAAAPAVAPAPAHVSPAAAVAPAYTPPQPSPSPAPTNSQPLPPFGNREIPSLAPPAAQPQPQQQVAAPAPAPAQPAAQAAQPAAPAQPKKSHTLTQLEIRAIFGVDHDLKENELLQRARTLSGVRNVAVIQADKAAAFEAVRSSIQTLGFGNADTLELAVEGGAIDFVQHGGVTLVVLHEGEYAPGVRETLMIVAREVGKLNEDVS